MEKSGKTSSNNSYFVGTYYHTLEEKGRVSVPKPWRVNLSKGAFITKGLDGCLAIFPEHSWSALTEKLASLPISQTSARAFLRSLTYNAAPIDFDSLGRTRIPENLIDLAGLKKDVVFAGALTRVELWSKSTFHSYQDSIDDMDEDVEETLKELGI